MLPVERGEGAVEPLEVEAVAALVHALVLLQPDLLARDRNQAGLSRLFFRSMVLAQIGRRLLVRRPKVERAEAGVGL